MKNRFLIAFVFAIITFTAQAQDPAATDTTSGPWTFGGTYSFTLNQVSLTNWQAGGANSVSGNMLLTLSANYQKHKRS